ncbi:MAG TPA: styrene monooxygenase/indole monooxygenase family protein [Patescibacteria group bacterium]|nr:styrene monooxygenase/indole monooxygenase family protein [Gammaproteobacteria bacterium]HWA52486.1 styrene monooxygenase/indole monooxygenase family protein [Patescibacteria group bacterium]
MAERTVAIIGAGQAGLLLGIGLLKSNKKYSVSIFTNKSAEQILQGGIMSSQGMFDSSLQVERELGINFWDTLCPQNKSVTFTLVNPETIKKEIYFQGKTTKPYQSIDQRLKFSRWMDEFEKLSGKIHIQNTDTQELNRITKEHELTIVATGKGEISSIFPINHSRSPFDKPQRALACIYVQGAIPADSLGVRAHIIPGIGEYFTMPGLTLNGHCEMMLFEGIFGNAFDCWEGLTNPEERLEKALNLLKNYLPWEAERFQNTKLTDNRGTLTGSYTPLVKLPISKLPCGKSVLGLGDAVVLNDPIAGQGANSAAKSASIYLKSILDRGQAPFDESWMTKTFELSWKLHAQWATQWTYNLLMPPPPHIIELFKAASHSQKIAKILADGFDNPATLFPWIMRSEETFKVIHNEEKQPEKLA